MKIEIELTDEQVNLIMRSVRVHGSLEERLKELFEIACDLVQMDAEYDAEYKLYRTFGLTPPGVMFDDEDIPF